MKLPSLKRRTTVSRKFSGPRPSMFLLVGTGIFLLSVVVGIYLFFPNETLKNRIIHEAEKRINAELQVRSVRFYPIMTLDLSGLNISTTGMSIPLVVDELEISPDWASLITGDPGVSLEALCMSGELSAVLQKSGTVTARAKNLQFDLPIEEPMSFHVAGTLKDADILAATRLDQGTETRMNVHLNDVRILGLNLGEENSPEIKLGAITLDLTGEGRSMQVKSLVATGGDFEVSGEGTLLIGRTAATSRIRITLQVKPGPNANSTLTSLLEISGDADTNGNYPLRLTGTITNPLLKPGG